MDWLDFNMLTLDNKNGYYFWTKYPQIKFIDIESAIEFLKIIEKFYYSKFK